MFEVFQYASNIWLHIFSEWNFAPQWKHYDQIGECPYIYENHSIENWICQYCWNKTIWSHQCANCFFHKNYSVYNHMNILRWNIIMLNYSLIHALPSRHKKRLNTQPNYYPICFSNIFVNSLLICPKLQQ